MNAQKKKSDERDKLFPRRKPPFRNIGRDFRASFQFGKNRRQGLRHLKVVSIPLIVEPCDGRVKRGWPHKSYIGSTSLAGLIQWSWFEITRRNDTFYSGSAPNTLTLSLLRGLKR